MKVAVYSCREFDEKQLFEEYAKELGLELMLCPDAPDMNNIELARGCQCATILTSKVPEELMAKFHEVGVRYLATRTIGYDHIDVEAAKKYGIHVANAPYGPDGVADYAVMLILMSLRHMKRILQRSAIQDYTLKGCLGKELKDLTVGVIGTGRIGKAVIRNLSGFGCKVIAYDLYPDHTLQVEYTELSELFARADVITLHTPLTEQNFHLISHDSLSQMKDGVVIVNTARGPLIDIPALIDAIEDGKIGAAALDVVENEFDLYYYDRKSDILKNRELAILRGFPNVTVSHHMAFYTENAVRTMVADSLTGCRRFLDGDENPWQVL